MSQETKFVQLGGSFPMVDRVWEVFQGKGIKTVFLSIGSSASALPDLELAESLGCPINIVPLKEDHKAKWIEVAEILKARKRDPTVATSFSEEAESKWILPKNIRIQSALPWWAAGSVDLSGSISPTEPALQMVERICQEMKVKSDQVRLDILKVDTVDTSPGFESAILSAILHAGLRPAIILVNWNQMPDQNVMVTCAAGHLQNHGYHLLAKNESRFLYYFNDNDMYQICSWEDTTVKNPMFTEITKAARPQRGQ